VELDSSSGIQAPEQIWIYPANSRLHFLTALHGSFSGGPQTPGGWADQRLISSAAQLHPHSCYCITLQKHFTPGEKAFWLLVSVCSAHSTTKHTTVNFTAIRLRRTVNRDCWYFLIYKLITLSRKSRTEH